MPTALISVSDKTGLAEFAKELHSKHDYTIIATGSTAKHLKEKGVDCVSVDSITAFPEILGGRVKTLHPRIFAGILARGTDEDMQVIADLGIKPIELVIVNLYQFEKKLEEGLPEEKMIEEIDIGGPSLLRAAAKNFERVAVACDPSQYDEILKSIQSNKGAVARDLRKKLAREVFEKTMRYDTAISAYFATIEHSGNNGCDKTEGALPSKMNVSLSKYQKLRYGENPHQSAVWYSAPQELSDAEPITFPPFETLQGKELSSNNIVDTYALVRILRELEPPATCIIKHNNPCGVGIAPTLKESYEKAYNTDPLSAFGGIFGFTGEVDEELAGLATQGFIEIIAAPAFTASALTLLSKKKNVRVLVFKPGLLSRPADHKWQARDLQDFGWIFEKDEEPPAQADRFDCVSGSLPANLKADVGFAWGVVRHLTSNAIFIAKDGVSLGFGIGQTSRIASVNIALAQAGEQARGAVLASDAFFPATDNIEAAAKAGISVIVQPGGSIKDDEVIKACKDNNITMLFTGQRCFKH